MRRRILWISTCFVLLVSACNTTSAPNDNTSTTDQSQENTSQQNIETTDKNVLIAYFSKTGNTEKVANMIAKKINGDIFQVESVEAYPENYDETVDIAKDEQNRDARPELSTHVENMNEYDVIFLGYPNWWGTMPMAMFTFLEEYDFTDKIIIPFCTHGGSALGRSEDDITRLAPTAQLKEGLAIRDSNVDEAESEVDQWLSSLYLE